MEKIAEFVDIVGYRSASKEAKKTFWGTILIKLGSGIVSIQATVIIYYFSFFHQVRNICSIKLNLDITIELLQFTVSLVLLHGQD